MGYAGSHVECGCIWHRGKCVGVGADMLGDVDVWICLENAQGQSQLGLQLLGRL